MFVSDPGAINKLHLLSRVESSRRVTIHYATDQILVRHSSGKGNNLFNHVDVRISPNLMLLSEIQMRS